MTYKSERARGHAAFATSRLIACLEAAGAGNGGDEKDRAIITSLVDEIVAAAVEEMSARVMEIVNDAEGLLNHD